jgi:hypothetical protein
LGSWPSDSGQLATVSPHPAASRGERASPELHRISHPSRESRHISHPIPGPSHGPGIRDQGSRDPRFSGDMWHLPRLVVGPFASNTFPSPLWWINSSTANGRSHTLQSPSIPAITPYNPAP